MLHWLKLWDGVVYGREKIKAMKKDKKRNQTNVKGPIVELDEELDQSGRPMNKVIYVKKKLWHAYSTLSLACLSYH